MSDCVRELLRLAAPTRPAMMEIVAREHFALPIRAGALDDDELRTEIGALLESRLGGTGAVVSWAFERLDRRALERLSRRRWEGEQGIYEWTDRAYQPLVERQFRSLLARMWEAERVQQRTAIDRLVQNAPGGWFVRVGATEVAAQPMVAVGGHAPQVTAGIASMPPDVPVAVGAARVSSQNSATDDVPAVRVVVDAVSDGVVRFHVEHADFAAWYLNSGVRVGFPPNPDHVHQFTERIVGVALRAQAAMLERGLEAQRPLRLREVADAVGHHESTISRVMQHVVIVHHGEEMPASALFSNALGDSGAQASISGAQARVALLAAIAAHPGASDEVLSGMLGRWGIPISRRTVAKYRGPDHLDIPSTNGPDRQDATIAAAIARFAPTEWLRAQVARRVFRLQDAVESGEEPTAGAAPESVQPRASHASASIGIGVGVAATTVVDQTIEIFARQEADDSEGDPDLWPGEPLAPWRNQIRFEFDASGALPAGLHRSMTDLFDHQKRALDALRSWWRNDGARGVLCLPTGAGKTRTAASFLVDTALPHARVLWLAHRIELLDQAIATLAAVSGRARGPFSVGRFQAGAMKVIRPTDVVVASIPTLARAFRGELRTLERLWRQQQGFDVVVVDECHHGAARTWRGLVEWVRETSPRTRILGLSATPTRSDQREATVLWRLFDRVVHEEAVPPLIESGVLARPHVVVVPTDRSFSATVREQELFETFAELPPTLVKRIAEDSARQEAVVRTWAERRAEWKQTLVFAATIAQAADLADRLNEAGARAQMVSGETKDAERRSIVDRFRRGEIDVVVNCGLFTEGTDIPGVSTVFLARPTRSRVLFQQMVGRAMRGPQVGGSAECNVVAFTDAVTGLMSTMLASTFATEHEALMALGLVEEGPSHAPAVGGAPERTSFDIGDLVQLLREMARDWSLDRAAAEPLVGWWEATVERRTRYLPVFDVDREPSTHWVADLRDAAVEGRRLTLIPPPFVRASFEVAQQFGEFACRHDAEVRFVLLRDLSSSGLSAAADDMGSSIAQGDPERVLVEGATQTHVLARGDYELLTRAWNASGFLLLDEGREEADATALADFIAYLRGVGTVEAADATLADILAACVRRRHVPPARDADEIASLEVDLAQAPVASWLAIVSEAAARQHARPEDMCLRLIERSLDRLADVESRDGDRGSPFRSGA